MNRTDRRVIARGPRLVRKVDGTTGSQVPHSLRRAKRRRRNEIAAASRKANRQ